MILKIKPIKNLPKYYKYYVLIHLIYNSCILKLLIKKELHKLIKYILLHLLKLTKSCYLLITFFSI